MGVGERGDGRERGGDEGAATEGGAAAEGGAEQSGGRHGRKLKLELMALSLRALGLTMLLSFFWLVRGLAQVTARLILLRPRRALGRWAVVSYKIELPTYFFLSGPLGVRTI